MLVTDLLGSSYGCLASPELQGGDCVQTETHQHSKFSTTMCSWLPRCQIAVTSSESRFSQNAEQLLLPLLSLLLWLVMQMNLRDFFFWHEIKNKQNATHYWPRNDFDLHWHRRLEAEDQRRSLALRPAVSRACLAALRSLALQHNVIDISLYLARNSRGQQCSPNWAVLSLVKCFR